MAIAAKFELKNEANLERSRTSEIAALIEKRSGIISMSRARDSSPRASASTCTPSAWRAAVILIRVIKA